MHTPVVATMHVHKFALRIIGHCMPRSRSRPGFAMLRVAGSFARFFCLGLDRLLSLFFPPLCCHNSAIGYRGVC